MKLTQTVKKGGCAAKIAAYELRDILNRVRFPKAQKELLINGSDFDDAAIFQINESQSLVKTLDFFTPIVDSPYLFGQIAAANAMSDVYAMGGIPKLALAILAFPLADMEKDIIAEILQGAVDKTKEANIDLAGGHSIDDDTLKFGLSVTGLVDHKRMWTNKGAQPGDKLILTKALGTGTLMASLKNEFLTEDKLQEAFFSMGQLNNVIPYLNEDNQQAIHAATDITGFGLAGHAYQMACASKVSLRFSAKALPRLQHVADALAAGHLTKAHGGNRQYTAGSVDMSGSLSQVDELMFFDPQTSGGLLLSVEATRASNILEKLKETFPRAASIGEVIVQDNKVIYYDI